MKKRIEPPAKPAVEPPAASPPTDSKIAFTLILILYVVVGFSAGAVAGFISVSFP